MQFDATILVQGGISEPPKRRTLRRLTWHGHKLSCKTSVFNKDAPLMVHHTFEVPAIY